MQNQFVGLKKETEQVFEAVSKLECIKGLYLCGGTSISLQINHRLSEDLDFELHGTKRERPELNINGIIAEIRQVFPGSELDMLGEDHFQIFLPNSTKLSFFRPENSVPRLSTGFRYGNIVTPSLQELLGMKIYTTTVRYAFRDYYDIYCLLEEGLSFGEGVKFALDFSRHTVHTKQLLSTLITPKLFPKESDFNEKLSPKYDIDPVTISERLKNEVLKYFKEKEKKVFPVHKIKI